MTEIFAKSAQQLWMVLLVGLALGAGLPALFATGLRGLTMGRTVSADGATAEGRTSLAGWIVAGACFAIVIAAIAFGIVVIVFGHQIFKH